MNKSQKLVFIVSTVAICGAILHTAFSKTEKAPMPEIAIANAVPGQPVHSEAVTTVNPIVPGADAKKAACSASGTSTDKKADSDGKTVMAGDGKEVLPGDGKDTKEVLPPVGESIGSRSQVIDAANPGAPPEYLPSNTPKPLLTPPNPTNVSGPVVSPEIPPVAPPVTGPTE